MDVEMTAIRVSPVKNARHRRIALAQPPTNIVPRSGQGPVGGGRVGVQRACGRHRALERPRRIGTLVPLLRASAVQLGAPSLTGTIERSPVAPAALLEVAPRKETLEDLFMRRAL